MARLNTRPSTIAGANSPIRGTPALDNNYSDQENEEPEAERPRRDKGKGRASEMSGRSTLPTPDSDTRDTAPARKRKRAEAQSATQAEDIDSDGEVPQDPEDVERFNRYYNPAQDPEQRRQVKRKSRALEREFNEKRDELIKGDGKELSETINRANNVFKTVRQTNDATVDSRLFVNLSSVAQRRSANLVLGDTQTGVDLDVLVSRACYFMQHGEAMNAEDGAAATQRQTQRRRARTEEDESDDDEDLGQPMDWVMFGKHACFPYGRRPACPSFLLGPLSVEKKVRKQTQRTARQTQDKNVRETRPEALTRAELSQSDENGLTAICKRIHRQLEIHCDQMNQKAAETFGSLAEMSTPAGLKWLKEHRITIEGGPSLFDFTLHPNSFGQTVENLFYVSFLIKEGVIGISYDQDGLPVLILTDPTKPGKAREEDAAANRRNKVGNVGNKHQAVFSLDYGTWQDLAKAFNVKEPMIPHRDETEGQVIGDRGWYT
ncbi:hypothetical protein DOTSEDRAFT_170771 [Dothistroma septosporum NZE10]|uniref:Non-structural maintenance of chromosomes element 4 n=1 Tax=Dothistroma septosporum (strain NZE10 / CBS 128990) TaxID=675120 RepID=N1PR30_DOTSN|nr:hypothetical protein DOTSEDRAFT_170771 [Dothistroma septosporum NZE10]